MKRDVMTSSNIFEQQYFISYLKHPSKFYGRVWCFDSLLWSYRNCNNEKSKWNRYFNELDLVWVWRKCLRRHAAEDREPWRYLHLWIEYVTAWKTSRQLPGAWRVSGTTTEFVCTIPGTANYVTLSWQRSAEGSIYSAFHTHHFSS